MKTLILLLLMLGGASTFRSHDDSEGKLLQRDLSYLTHLRLAEKHLQAGHPAMSLQETRQGIDLKVPNTGLKMMKVAGSSATAHFLNACALSLKGDLDAALASLKAAAQAGFTDAARVRNDPWLAAVRRTPGFGEALKLFPKQKLTDEYAGKTVKDGKFGNGLIRRRIGNFPKLGERAPDFELTTRDGKQKIRLSSFQGKKPVVLIFGSFT